MPDVVETPQTPADQYRFIEEWLVHWLLGLPELKAVVGDKVFPVAIPNDRELPAVVFTRRGTTRQGHQTADFGTPTGMWDVTCWVTGPNEFGSALAAAKAIREPILNTLLKLTRERGMSIRRVTVEDEFDAVADPAQGDDMAGVGRVLRLAIQYRE